MTTLPARPIPDNYRRIVLVNPTRYLGNLLIAGGLIQQFYQHCRSNGVDFRLVVDESFRELLRGAIPEDIIVFYPRKRIHNGGGLDKIRLYWSCLKKIRDFRADIAFNIEEDNVSHRLTLLSGARFKVGCSIGRHQHGYDHVLRVVFAERPPGEGHRWYGFRQSFAAVGMTAREPGYIRLNPSAHAMQVRSKASAAGVDFTRKMIALHTGATKDFKRWPANHFVRLAELLLETGAQVLLIGAGPTDSHSNREILESLKDKTSANDVVDLANVFTLNELAAFFTLIDAIVGNDSGPFHLASAVELPGCVIFGPTETALWHPLSGNSKWLKGIGPCAPECTKTGCIHEQRCLKSITPETVLHHLNQVISL